MEMLLLIRNYFHWHYGTGTRDLLGTLRSLSWFFAHLFSLRLLFATLLSPFYRIREDYFSIADIEKTLASITANLVSRAVGLLLRLIVIALGLIVESTLLLMILPVLIAWIFLPAIIIGFFWLGIAGFFA